MCEQAFDNIPSYIQQKKIKEKQILDFYIRKKSLYLIKE